MALELDGFTTAVIVGAASARDIAHTATSAGSQDLSCTSLEETDRRADLLAVG